MLNRISDLFKKQLLPVALTLMSGLGHAESPDLLAQRELFLQAEAALANQNSSYSRFRQQLTNYPLAPYLDYQHLKRRLKFFPRDDVAAFLEQHGDTYLGSRLGQDWLKALARSGRWEDYRQYFEKIQPTGAELRCYFLHARLMDGDKAALDDVAPLWNVGHSQVNACDPVFDIWMNAGRLTDELAWERHKKTIAAGNFSLARYIAKQMSPEYRKLAELYARIHRQPDHLAKTRELSPDNPKSHEVILHGISRYALRDSLAALQLWERFDASHLFEAEARREVQENLIIHLVVDGHTAAADKLLKQRENITNSELIAWLVRDALRNEDWQRVYNSIQLFQAEEQEHERWLYWRARALEQLQAEDPHYGTADHIYARLALSRNFYGFLAADFLGRDYSLAHQPVNPAPDLLDATSKLPAMERARELFFLGRDLPARREWASATRDMDPVQLLAAGTLAEQWGWYHQSIQSTIRARHWDDLQLRFPLAYAEDVSSAAAQTAIEPPLLYAIARQESAFATDARSPAGALGLMQLLPTTAQRTARQIGLAHARTDLVNPSHNIQLGSHYLHELLQEFNGSRVLATAAYNAGPYRVKQWLENGSKRLPYDIWIETIPYRETRSYVQNVLSFSVIYAHRMGKQWPLLKDVTDSDQEPQDGLLKVGSVDDA